MANNVDANVDAHPTTINKGSSTIVNNSSIKHLQSFLEVRGYYNFFFSVLTLHHPVQPADEQQTQNLIAY